MNTSFIILCGDRDWTDPVPVEIVILGLRKRFPKLVIAHGAAPGLDSIAEKICESWNIPSIPFPADWKMHGRSAGPIRNREMYDACAENLELVIGFHTDIMGKTPRGGKRGTRDMLELAEADGIPAYLVNTWPL